MKGCRCQSGGLLLQVVATLLSNWGQHWFTHFPHPPLPVLGQLQELMAFHDPDLFQAMSSGQPQVMACCSKGLTCFGA